MRIKAAVVAGIVTAIGVASAAAAPPEVPGVPGQANCHGQTIAYFAQVGKQDQELRERGIGQLARFNGATVEEIKSEAAADCALP
jgi:hypothetical protein